MHKFKAVVAACLVLAYEDLLSLHSQVDQVKLFETFYDFIMIIIISFNKLHFYDSRKVAIIILFVFDFFCYIILLFAEDVDMFHFLQFIIIIDIII